MTGILFAMLPVLAAATIPPPPRPPVIGERGPSGQVMLAWLPGEVRCGQAIVAPESLPHPAVDLTWASAAAGEPQTYFFDIDSDGRAVSIRRLARDARAIGSEDVAPSLAAARFAAANPLSGCAITYVPRQGGLAQAPVADLMSYAMNPRSGPLPEEGWQRLYEGGNCRDQPAPSLRNQAFPDFRAIPAVPGDPAWSMIGYDIDVNGRTSNIRPLAGTGNSTLDAASRQAVEDTSYYTGGRTGCHYPYWRGPATLPAPAPPDPESFRPAGANCPDRRDWVVAPVLRYLEPYRRRAIEGWAIVTFDVAPWGEIGNIKVAASQPTDEIGNQAIEVMRAAKLPTTQGFVGCVNKVAFEMTATEVGDRNPSTAF